MDLVILADTHELHHELQIPPGDILIHAGDWTMFSKSLRKIEDFNAWVGDLPHRRKLLVPGNHEFYLEADPGRRTLTDNATVLIDQAVEIDGLKFYGSPMTPLYGGAFGRSSPIDRQIHWARVPNDTNVLVVHGPPFGILDSIPGQADHVGDPELLARCQELPNLRLVCFGHVHAGHGMEERDGVLYVNAALMGIDGELAHSPVVLRMSPTSK
jgi:Icc-related predicted phosphoesterase